MEGKDRAKLAQKWIKNRKAQLEQEARDARIIQYAKVMEPLVQLTAQVRKAMSDASYTANWHLDDEPATTLARMNSLRRKARHVPESYNHAAGELGGIKLNIADCTETRDQLVLMVEMFEKLQTMTLED